jgi:hypothetical protein
MIVTRILRAAALALLAGAPAHAADKRMVSYDAVSPEARKLTGAGLTFVFTKSMLRTRVLAVHATAVPVGVVLKPSGDGQTNRRLDALMGREAKSGAFYQIDPAQEQGAVMVQAFCPGSKNGWLAIGALAHARPLRVHAFGDDPATGQPRLCAAMDFAYRGEWRMPRENPADPTKEVFAPNW